MVVFNTLSRKKEEFHPLKKNAIGIYVCGPTVYDVGHLGHARAAVSFDVIRRYFEYRNFEVTYVSNITDVDDKIIKRAAEEGVTENELAERIIPEYTKDYGVLKVKPPTHQPRATQYIPKMVALIERLLKKDIAYETESGIYFSVEKFREYGKLSGQNLEELRAGARVEVDEKKKNPEDFALWKKAKPGEPTWKGPRGMVGRPGWHIECSAMSMDLLGETFDIHGGGIDLQFPHHEDEVAQSEAVTGKTFARYWLHNGHIQVNKEKMSKSLGNFFTIKEILAKYHPAVIRYFLLSSHYRMPIDYTPELLEQAKASLNRLQDFWRLLRRMSPEQNLSINKFHSHSRPHLEKLEHDFVVAMDDDFEMSQALAAIFEFIREMNILIPKGALTPEEISALFSVFQKIESVLQVMEPEEGLLSTEIEKLIEERNQARAEKNFQRSDEIRNLLTQKGIMLEDTKAGTVWKRML